MAWLRNAAENLVVPALLLVVGVFLIVGAVSIWTTWRDAKALMISLQWQKAETAAEKIDQYFVMMQNKFHPITQNEAPDSMPRNRHERFEYLRMLGEIPAIRSIVQLDAAGQSGYGISRLMHGPEPADYSSDPRFTETRKHGKYVGPTYLFKGSEPSVSFAMAHAKPHCGVTLVELNITWLWDIIDSIRVGKTGYAYVVDQEGRLIATRDKAQMLRYTQVPSALHLAPDWTPGEGMTFDKSPGGAPALSVYAVVPTLAWKVFVELPVEEARAPLWHAVACIAGLMALGLMAIFLASVLAARSDIRGRSSRD